MIYCAMAVVALAAAASFLCDLFIGRSSAVVAAAVAVSVSVAVFLYVVNGEPSSGDSLNELIDNKLEETP